MPPARGPPACLRAALACLALASLACGPVAAQYKTEVAQLTVVSPAVAAAGLPPALAAVADFGPNPYGGAIRGQALFPGASSNQTFEGCGAPGAQEAGAPQAFPPGAFPPGTIALVDRGTCRFIEKVFNAMSAGASAVVVMDNTRSTTLPQMVSPTTGDGWAYDVLTNITVPSVLVSRQWGTTLKQLAGLAAQTGEPADALAIDISWADALHRSDLSVDVEVWSSSRSASDVDDIAHDFKRDFADDAIALAESGAAVFTPRYLVSRCCTDDPASVDRETPLCGSSIAAATCGSDCINGGRYCHDTDGHADVAKLNYTGADILMMDLRELAVHQWGVAFDRPSAWWEYVACRQAGPRGPCLAGRALRVGAAR